LKPAADHRQTTRLLARHCLTGIIASWALLLGLVWTDVGQIGTLMDRSPVGWIGYLMLAVAFASTGGAIGIGVAVSSGPLDQPETLDRKPSPR
jgi:hypothetical protein